MRLFWKAIGTLGLVATLAPAPASAQQSDNAGPATHVSDTHRSPFFDLHPELTKDEFEQVTRELGSVLRFRQLRDTTTVRKGDVDLSVQFANARIDDSKAAWNNTISHPTADQHVSASMSFPRVVARFGVSDRVDVGALGGLAPRANYGLVGVDSRIALLQQGPTRPVSVSVRPSITLLVAPSEVLVGNAGVDLSVSRAIGPVSPYAGVAASTSGAVERSKNVDLDPVSAGASLAYAGLSYRWRPLILSAEVEKGAQVRYAFGIGTRF